MIPKATTIPIDPPSLDILSNKKRQQVDTIINGVKLTDEDAQKIREIFQQEMDLGLDINSEKKSCLQMANTYVPQLPDGTEEGEYLALDLGGTNFRILLLQLSKGVQVNEFIKFYHIQDALRLGPAVDLFDYLAECLHQFLSEHDRLSEKFTIGFTFSFPMEQKGLNSGVLVSWTKSFNCAGAVGEDAVKMLNDAIKKRGDISVEVTAILNDTTGTLVQGAYLDKTTGIGLILGTGSNGCYIEDVDKVLDWQGGKPDDAKEVIIDIEFGAFGDNGVLDFIRTDFDVQVDNNSLLVNSFTFEKYIAGKYMGELVRVILVKLYEEKLVFWGPTAEVPANLLKSGAFSTRLVSYIEEDSIHNRSEQTKAILEELELDFGMEDVAIVKYVCYLASNRAAKLVSVCLAYLLDRMKREGLVTIAVDGSLFQFHPRFRSLMEHYIHKFAPERQFALMMAEDGSGKGAGMVAAIANKLRATKL